MRLLRKIGIFPPRYGPEWGSGGIFGLKYHRETLYFTLAFEAKAYFLRDDGEKIYRFELVGSKPGPRSGGDTYNAVETVDEYIYFGGWVHSPASKVSRENGRTIPFYNKFSHVHSYNTEEDEVRLLWQETIRQKEKWTGEVSEIVYDPVNDRLLLARADGHENLGIYSLERKGGTPKKLSETPGLKGCILADYACFDLQERRVDGEGTKYPPLVVKGFQCLDLETGRWVKKPIKAYPEISVDSHDVLTPVSGCALSAYHRLFHFVRGGVIVGNPVEEEGEMAFIRLFDFYPSNYSPARTVALPVGGGILVPFNAYPEGVLHRDLLSGAEQARWPSLIVGPSVLLYITPPVARVVAVLGARVTSMERVGDEILIATNTCPNLYAHDATSVDAGYRMILSFPDSLLLSRSPPVLFKIKGYLVEDRVWGGIPVYGYREATLKMRVSKENRLTVYSYDFSLPPDKADETTYTVKEGVEEVDLTAFKGIVSFKLEKKDARFTAKIYMQ